MLGRPALQNERLQYRRGPIERRGALDRARKDQRRVPRDALAELAERDRRSGGLGEQRLIIFELLAEQRVALPRPFFIERRGDRRKRRRFFEYDRRVGGQVVEDRRGALRLRPRRDGQRLERRAAALRFDRERAH